MTREREAEPDGYDGADDFAKSIDAAYEAIKYRIITCNFRPGECINEAGISALLGFGRTPVHEAIDRLMLEDFVEVIPRKGVIVKPVNRQDVMQMVDVRLINETACARLAVTRADDHHIDRLIECHPKAGHPLIGEG